jgi:hypothetical protein
MSADAIVGRQTANAIARQKGVQTLRLLVEKIIERCMIGSILALCHLQLVRIFYDAFHKSGG